MKLQIIGFVAAAALLAAQPAAAQSLSIVHDPTSLAKSLVEYKNQLTELRNQVENGRQMISQGQELFESFNKISNIGDLGQLLNDPALRQFVPEDVRALGRAANGDWDSLGDIGNRAQSIRDENRFWTPEGSNPTDADREYRESLDRRGNIAARDVAVGEHIDETATRRLKGIEELRGALDSADSVRAVMDIQARLAAEGAMIANDNMRLQGMEMRQRAERELEQQRMEQQDQQRRSARMQALNKVIEGQN